MARRMMCGPSWAADFQRSLFIETFAFVGNKVHFKSGAIFAADRSGESGHFLPQ